MPNPSTLSALITTRTYVLPAKNLDAYRLMRTLVAGHPYRSSVIPGTPKTPRKIHVKVTGPSRVHSAMLAHFEWTGQ